MELLFGGRPRRLRDLLFGRRLHLRQFIEPLLDIRAASPTRILQSSQPRPRPSQPSIPAGAVTVIAGNTTNSSEPVPSAPAPLLAHNASAPTSTRSCSSRSSRPADTALDAWGALIQTAGIAESLCAIDSRRNHRQRCVPRARWLRRCRHRRNGSAGSPNHGQCGSVHVSFALRHKLMPDTSRRWMRAAQSFFSRPGSAERALVRLALRLTVQGQSGSRAARHPPPCLLRPVQPSSAGTTP